MRYLVAPNLLCGSNYHYFFSKDGFSEQDDSAISTKRPAFILRIFSEIWRSKKNEGYFVDFGRNS